MKKRKWHYELSSVEKFILFAIQQSLCFVKTIGLSNSFKQQKNNKTMCTVTLY